MKYFSSHLKTILNEGIDLNAYRAFAGFFQPQNETFLNSIRIHGHT